MKKGGGDDGRKKDAKVENNNVLKKGGQGGHLHNLGHLGENDMVIHRKQQDGYFHQVLILVFVLVHHRCLLSPSLFVLKSHKARVPLGIGNGAQPH
jgi:hypothetical protein